MQEPYFIRVAKQTPTEFWINNPTRDQADVAIANGATGCTNNPSYSQKMVDHPTEGAYALKLLDESIKESPSDDEAIAIFQRKLVKPISDRFLPIFTKSNEDQGYVSIQGDPIREDDPDVVIREALENRKLSPNICCKIPTTHSGLAAMEYLVGKSVPLNATEIFGIKQATV
jgi:transaldolase